MKYLLFSTIKLLIINYITKRIGNFFKLPIQFLLQFLSRTRVINQYIADGNYVEALRFRDAYINKYGDNNLVTDLIDSSSVCNDVNVEENNTSSQKYIWIIISLVIIILGLVFLLFHQRNSNPETETDIAAVENYEPCPENQSDSSDTTPQFDLYAQSFSGLLNASIFDPFGGLFGDASNMTRVTFQLRLFDNQTYSSTITIKVTDASIRKRLENAGEASEFVTKNSGTFRIDGNELILKSSDGNSDILIIDRENKMLKFYAGGQLAGELLPDN